MAEADESKEEPSSKVSVLSNVSTLTTDDDRKSEIGNEWRISAPRSRALGSDGGRSWGETRSRVSNVGDVGCCDGDGGVDGRRPL